jgi:outer membrane receptor protein involved in Fe transport
MIKRFSLKSWVLVFALLCNSLFAFSNPEVFKDGKVRGIIIDKQTNEPVEYATIALYQQNNNSLVTGTITDFNGYFKLENLELGSYYIVISFIGYEDLKIEQIEIRNDKNNINLGNIFLNSLAKELEEFEVVGKKASIEFKIDKKVINVDKQITAESGTAVDVLENVPSVQVDVEGNVTLRGSSGFTVLIDGRPTILDPSDVLRQIPASSIENIEIITNPSVKYNPDGATGIINVITKKNPFEGISGIVNANLGNFNRYGGDLQLNYRLNKVNFVFAANYNKNTRPGYSVKERVNSSNDSIFYVNSYGESDRYNISNSVRGGLEYSISKNDFFSLSGTYGTMDMNRSTQLRYDDWTFPETIFLSYNSLDEMKRNGDYYNLDIVYQHDFPKKKKKEIIRNEKIDEVESAKSDLDKGKKQGFRKANVHYLKLESSYQYRNLNEISTSQISTLSEILFGGKKNVEI